jgi:proline racemase
MMKKLTATLIAAGGVDVGLTYANRSVVGGVFAVPVEKFM